MHVAMLTRLPLKTPFEGNRPLQPHFLQKGGLGKQMVPRPANPERDSESGSESERSIGMQERSPNGASDCIRPERTDGVIHQSGPAYSVAFYRQPIWEPLHLPADHWPSDARGLRRPCLVR